MKRVCIAVAALVLVATACGGDDEGSSDTTGPTTTAVPTTSGAPTTTSTPTTTQAQVAAVVVAASELGDILTDQDGSTLYLFLPDGQGPSVCNGECADAWPPLAAAQAGTGIDASLLGTATRDDGSEQATYNGWPLYYFAADLAPGDVNGQGVNDVWYVLDVAGNAVGLEEAAATTVVVASSALGEILADQDGNTLYVFLPDEQGPSVCSGACAEAWPPLVDAVAGEGLDGSLLATAARDDGSLQITYAGWPLYYFAADSAPGDVNGQGVNDVWFVLDAAGNVITG